jgi:hypothetical protein
MMRFVFTGLAALGVLAAITFWWRPQDPAIPTLVLVSPPAPAPAPEAELAPAPAPEAEPAPQAEVPLEPAAGAATRAAPSPEPALGERTLEEEELVVVERRDFEDGPGPDSAADADAEDPLVSEGVETDVTGLPVDVERSGVLIRRMLALYDTFRE